MRHTVSRRWNKDADASDKTAGPELPARQSRQTPTGRLCRCRVVSVWVTGGALRKKRLAKSETACQGILVGVCIEVSQYEGFLLAVILEAEHRNGTVSSLHGTSRLAASLSTLRQHQPSHKGVENMTLDPLTVEPGYVAHALSPGDNLVHSHVSDDGMQPRGLRRMGPRAWPLRTAREPSCFEWVWRDGWSVGRAKRNLGQLSRV